MKKTTLILGVLGVMCYLTFSSCKKDKTTTTQPTTTLTLYDSLGGTTMVDDPSNPGQMIEKGRLGIRSVVDSTIFIIAGDDSLNTKFFSVLLGEVGSGNLTGFTALSKNLTDFFCVATGAKDYSYTGLSMMAAHNPATNPRMGAKATSGNFDQFVTDLAAGATKVGLPGYLISRVGTVTYTVESQVVQQ